MKLRIKSAHYANPEHSVIIADTEDLGCVLCTQEPSRIEYWKAVQEWIARGNAPAAFVRLPAPPKRDLAEELDSLKTRLAERGVLTPIGGKS